MEFSVVARQGSRVQPQTPFVFDVQAQSHRQTIRSESLRIEPDLANKSWFMAESGNRYFGIIAPSERPARRIS